MSESASTVSLDARLDALVQRILARNKETQAAKNDGPGGWIVALVLALISFIGIGAAMWLASRRGRELAKVRTALEKDEVQQLQARHEARKVTLLLTRQTLIEELNQQDGVLQERRKRLLLAEVKHRDRLRKIDSLTAWKDLNKP